MSSPPIRKIESVQNINIVIYINKNGEVEVDLRVDCAWQVQVS